MARTLEVETKFHVDDWFVPDLGTAAELGEPVEHLLAATYYDTPALDLLKAGWTLRRRLGGTDAGWHLKRPASDAGARLEVQAPPGPSLPAELEAEAREIAGKAPLVPVGRLDSVRTAWPVRVRGKEIASLTVDRVSATVGGEVQSWTELEIELLPRVDRRRLGPLARAVLASGAEPSPHASKAARALAAVTPFVEPDNPDAPAADVLRAYLAQQVGMIQAMNAPVRENAGDAVHKMRVASRRLRSILRSFGPLLDRDRTDPVRDELRWLGELLGKPRDAEVQLEEFTGLLENLGDDATAESRSRLLGHLGARHDEGHAALVRELDGQRFAQLLTRLTDLVADPPVADAARKRAGKRLPDPVARTVKRVRKLAGRAEQDPDHLEGWHEVRKAAKAARYSHEAVAAALGEEYSARAKAWEAVTEAFGALQDTSVAHELLGRMIAEAEAAGESAEPFRALLEQMDARTSAVLAEGRAALEAALST